ncbi:hypothetical protein EV1_044835 [Malus domestica]
MGGVFGGTGFEINIEMACELAAGIRHQAVYFLEFREQSKIFVFLLCRRIITFSLEESTERASGDYLLQSAIGEPSELSMQSRLGEEQEAWMGVQN